MKTRGGLFSLLASVACLALAGAARAGGDVGPRPPGSFDYYVLSLTWVPGFCITHRSDTECSGGTGFGLHGLWPQFASGDYPTSCGARPLSPSERSRFAGVYPNPSMIDHEWSRHGTCSGLSPAGYFSLSIADERRVTIPAALRSPRMLMAEDGRFVRQAFLAANPGLPVDGITVSISRGVVTGVEICVSRSGAFRSCRG